jgi:hypothetical protein
MEALLRRTIDTLLPRAGQLDAIRTQREEVRMLALTN